MRTINYLIVKLGEAYNNEDTILGDKSFIVNSTIEDVSFINREATVVSAPDFTIIEEGDKVIAHHNIFRLRNDVRGSVAPSNFWIKDDLYFIPLSEVFMYNRGTGWVSIEPFCFIEPIDYEPDGFFELVDDPNKHKGRQHKKGIIRYSNKELESQGVVAGDLIMFSDWSEYEFKVDGKILYKMSTKDVLGKI